MTHINFFDLYGDRVNDFVNKLSANPPDWFQNFKRKLFIYKHYVFEGGYRARCRKYPDVNYGITTINELTTRLDNGNFVTITRTNMSRDGVIGLPISYTQMTLTTQKGIKVTLRVNEEGTEVYWHFTRKGRLGREEKVDVRSLPMREIEDLRDNFVMGQARIDAFFDSRLRKR